MNTPLISNIQRTQAGGLPTVWAVTRSCNEERYIAEWVAYHRLIGVSGFMIYDDCSDDGSVLAASLMGATSIPGTVKNEGGNAGPFQRAGETLQRMHHGPDWVLFIDLDEYVCVDGDFLPSYLARAPEDVGNILLSWKLFGSHGKEAYERRPTPTRFSMASLPEDRPNRFVKSCVRTIAFDGFRGSNNHYAHVVAGYRHVNARFETAQMFSGEGTHGRPFLFFEHPVWESCYLHHYAVRSRQEFDERKRFGQPDGTPIDEQYWVRRNLNKRADPRLIGLGNQVGRVLGMF